MSDAEQFPTEASTAGDGAVMDDASQLDGSEDLSESPREIDDQREKYLRLAAEYDNFRKRTARERQEARLRGQADMLKGMIDALDDLGRFAHVDPATTDAKTVVEGVEMVEKKLLKTLAGHGLEIVEPERASVRSGAARGGDDRARWSQGRGPPGRPRVPGGIPVQRAAAAPRARRGEAVERLTP